ncbi:unnamed protein product [Vicia faba]|uniref:Uncharacterized protein n=1 Tax=Vicia faba TaxID=3906 RepID=A0AAV1AXX1_VICFA|nr:unnamed protein product [Vicia faba]
MQSIEAAPLQIAMTLQLTTHDAPQAHRIVFEAPQTFTAPASRGRHRRVCFHLQKVPPSFSSLSDNRCCIVFVLLRVSDYETLISSSVKKALPHGRELVYSLQTVFYWSVKLTGSLNLFSLGTYKVLVSVACGMGN